MLDSKNVQGMREALAQAKEDNKAALEQIKKYVPSIQKELRSATEALEKAKAKAETLTASAAEQLKEPKWYAPAVRQIVEFETLLQGVPKRLEALRGIQRSLKGLNAQDRADLVQLATEARKTAGAPDIVEHFNDIIKAAQNPASLDAEIKMLNNAVINANNMLPAARKKLDDLMTSYQNDVVLRRSLDRQAKKAVADVDAATKRLREAQKAYREDLEKSIKAETKPDELAATPDEVFKKAAQAGREGLGLEGERIERDTLGLREEENGLRSKIGSLEDQMLRTKSEKRKAQLQEQIDETEAELAALPEKAPVERKLLGERTDADIAFEKEQLAQTREKNKELELATTLPNRVVGLVAKNTRTGRVTQEGKRRDIVGASQEVTNALIARRAELAELNRRKDFLESKGKAVPRTLTADIKKAEKAVDTARNEQNKIAAEELATRKAFRELQGKRIAREAKRFSEADEENRMARGVETVSPDLSPAQVSMLKKNDLTGALDSFADDKDTSKLNKIVAQRLAAMLDNTNIKLVNNLKDNEGRSALGMATSKLITLDSKTGLSQEVLLHEGTHAATERVLVQYEKDPSKLTEIQRVAVRELKALHKAIQNDPRITSASAKGSLSEFVAEVFSNRNLQEQLRQKKWRLSDAWKGFKSIIMRMLGIKDPETMLGAALQSVDALMIPSSQRTGVSGKAVTKQLSQKDIAALYTGSNSMKQFAEAFGTTHIKQKDRTAEDANRIGQEYLDDMYSNPLDYVAEAAEDKLAYPVRMSDGKELDLENPLHYVEADAEQLANLKARNDAGLRRREAQGITRERKKDLQSLVRNMMDTPEFTYVEQALVAKAASKFAVLADKNGRLKLASIEPNNRHNIALVSSQDAASVIEELRAGKPLKEAFLAGMQKNADRNAKLNETRNGWYKFDQSDNYKDAEKLSAGAAGTSWCTSGKSMAAHQLKNGDFYINYVNGKPSVAVRMDGKNKIGEVRGNTPTQALTSEQLETAETFLKSNNFEGSDIYVKELDKKKFLQKVAKGEADFSPEDLLSANRVFNEKGGVSNFRLDQYLSFSTIDGHVGLRPDPSPKVRDFFAKKMKEDAVVAYKSGHYVFADISLLDFQNGVVKIEFDGQTYKARPEDVKSVHSLMVSHMKGEEKTGTTLPSLKSVVKLSIFNGGLTAPALQSVDEISVFYGPEKKAELTVPSNANIGVIHPAKSNAFLTLRGAESVDQIRLRRYSYQLTLVAPELKYATVDDGLVGYTNDVANKYTTALRDLVEEQRGEEVADAFKNFETYWDNAVDEGKDTSAVEKATEDYNRNLLNAVRKVLPADLQAKFEKELNQKDDFLIQSPFENADTVSNFLFARAENEEVAADYFREIVEEVFPKIDITPVGTDLLLAPKFIGERPAVQVKEGEAPEMQRYAKAQATGFEDELSVASELIAKPKTTREKIEANLGLSFRTQFLDRLAPLEKVANEMLDPLRGTQMMYYLRMADQKMSFVQQAVGRGVPQLVDVKRADGQTERLIESKEGPNLAEVVTTLKEAPGMNAEAANQLFTLYLAGKRGDRVGYDKLNFGVPEAQIKSAIAKIEGNKELRDVFEKAREQYNAYNRDLMKFMEQTGALTPEEAKRLASTNDYIPYYREENGNAVLVIGGEGTYKIGSLAEQPQLRQLIGGNDKILDFLTSSVQNTSMLLDMGLRNQATKNAMFELADLKLAQFLGGTPSGPDIVRFKDKGVDKYVRINTDELGIPADLLVKGMEGIPVNNSALVRTMGGFSTLLRRSITVSPLYAARQLFRDSLAAPLLSGANFTPVMGALRQLGKSDTRETLEARGIVGGQVFTGTNEDLTRILGELQAGKMGLSQFIARAEGIAMEADALTRRAQYDSYIEQGLSQMEATLMSLESMNFNRKGLSPSVRLATQLIPFFNAQVQSLDVLYRAMTGKMPMNERLQIQEKLFKRGALLAGTAVAYALLMQDDDTYKNAQPDEKYGNFFVHVPGISEAIRVPVPFEIGYIFKGIPEAMVNIMANERGAEEAYKAFKNIAIQTIPGGSSALMPAAVKPLVENLTNYSFFTGRSLETRAEQMEKAEFRYRDNTSELAKQVGALTGVSPIKIENLIRGYTGGMGLALAQALNFSMPTAGSPEQATKRLSDAAVIGPLFQPADAGGQVSAVYDRISDIAETKRTYDKLVKEGRMADARALVQDDVEKFSKYAVAGNVQEQLGKITQAMNAIKASTLSADEKREQLDKLQALRIQIAKSVREAL
jgi:hypothetical protein